jgi:hypothetical protein
MRNFTNCNCTFSTVPLRRIGNEAASCTVDALPIAVFFLRTAGSRPRRIRYRVVMILTDRGKTGNTGCMILQGCD